MESERGLHSDECRHHFLGGAAEVYEGFGGPEVLVEWCGGGCKGGREGGNAGQQPTPASLSDEARPQVKVTVCCITLCVVCVCNACVCESRDSVSVCVCDRCVQIACVVRGLPHGRSLPPSPLAS